MGYDQFIKLRLESLGTKSVDDYVLELLEADIDISMLMMTDPPKVSDFKNCYEKFLAQAMNEYLQNGGDFASLTKIFAKPSTLKNLLEQLKSPKSVENPQINSLDHPPLTFDDRKNPSISSPPSHSRSDLTEPANSPFSSVLDFNKPSAPLSPSYPSTNLGLEPSLNDKPSLASLKSTDKPNEFQIPHESNPKLGWKCSQCTFQNSKGDIRCSQCSHVEFLEKGRIDGVEYSILSTHQSQYNLGAVSACTTMSFQALYDCLQNISGTEIPFGCTPDLLDSILCKGSIYTGKRHQDIDDVTSSRPDLMEQLFQFPGMIDLDPRNPYQGLKRGEQFFRQVQSSIGCIITCQAQSLCLIYVHSTNMFVIFDSHSRQHNGRTHGACLLFFSSLMDVSSYLQHLFPPIDQPDLAWQSLQEQLQYAHLSVGQADFFCLKKDSTRFYSQQKTMTSPATPTAAAPPPSSLPTPPPVAASAASFKTPQSTTTTTTAPHQPLPSVPSHAPAITTNFTSPSPMKSDPQVPMVSMDAMIDYVKPLFEENKRLREKLNDIDDRVIFMKREYEERLDNERASHRQTKQANELFEERTKYLFKQHTDLIEELRMEVIQTKRELGKLKDDFSNTINTIGRTSNNRPPSPWCMVNSHEASYPKTPNTSSPLISADKNTHNSTNQRDDYPISSSSFEDDLKFAQQLQDQEEEEERLLMKQIADEKKRNDDLIKMAERDAALAKQFYFRCCICLDDEVDIEDKFDLEHLDHCVCRNCATSYIQIAVKNRDIPVKCMHNNCQYILPETKCFEVLQENEQISYLKLSGRPHADPQFRQCPVPDCAGFYLVDPNSNDCECYFCHHHWCCQCQVDLDKSQHQNISCEKYQQWKKENDQGDESMEKFLRAGLNDVDGDDRMRRCPNCNTAYMKDKACNHVVCTGGCGVHFCFRCAKFHASSAGEIYNHQGACKGYTGE